MARGVLASATPRDGAAAHQALRSFMAGRGLARAMEPGGWPVAVEIRVPWRDIDVAGHLNNAVYFAYMETARVEAYMSVMGKTRPEHVDFIVARAACDFHSPAYMGETLVVRVQPTRVGNTSFTLKYEMREKATQRLVAEGETVQVMYDYEKKAKKPIPPDLRKLLDA
jgi:acyl-CoA thioester hydrolase